MLSAEVQQALKAIPYDLLKDVVVLDSGCHTTTFNDLKWFKTIAPLPTPTTSLASNSGLVETTHAGVALWKTTLSSGTVVTFELANSLYQPLAPCNLLSTSDLEEKGVFWDPPRKRLYHLESGQTLAEIQRDFRVPTILAQPAAPSPPPSLLTVPYRTMHRRLMHASKAVVLDACKKAGIVVSHKEDTFCEGCAMGKAHDEHGDEAPTQGEDVLDLIRMDLVTHKNPGHLGYRYSIPFIDTWSNYHWVRFARDKNDAFAALRAFEKMANLQTGRKVKIVGIDGGTEFGQASKPQADSKFDAWLRSKGMVTFRTTPETPWMNGKVERAAKHVLELTRSTILAYNIPERLFPFVMETVCQVINVLPCRANPGNQSPQEMLAKALNMPAHAHKPYLRHFRAYFCEAYYYVKPHLRAASDKFTARAQKGRLIGYADLHGKIYWIWNPITDKVVRASAVRFNEGPDFKPDDDIADVEYEAVFADTSTQEEADLARQVFKKVTLVTPDEEQPTDTNGGAEAQEVEEEDEDTFGWFDAEDGKQGNNAGTGHLPTPDATPENTPDPTTPQPTPEETPGPSREPTRELSPQPVPQTDASPLDASDLQEIREEGPIPPDHALAPYTGHATTQMPSMGGSTAQEEPPQRPRRGKARYGTGKEEGYYAKLAKGELPGQSFYSDHLVEPAPLKPLILLALTHLKAEHDIETSRRADLPQNYRQAKRLSNFESYWLPAMRKQDEKLRKMRVYDLVAKRPGMVILPTKWVYDEKTDLDTATATARARWVVCGNFEQGSWNSQDLYAAVVNSVSVKIFFALVAVLGLECWQYDFVAAFLNALILDGAEYFVEPPAGLGKPAGFVAKLNKALYGLRRSPLYWFLTIKPVMESLGFESLLSDLCLFRHKETGILVCLYVDDLLIAARTVEAIHRVRDQLRAIFELKEIGEVRRFLGFDVIRDRAAKKIYISQASYIKALLKKVGMWDVDPVQTPWPNKFELPTTWEPVPGQQKGYIKKTGSVNWVSTGTRVDIAYTVSRLCEANSGPSQAHLDLMRHLFRYLRGTWDYCLEFGGNLDITDLKLRGFGDASLADRLPSRHSTGGHVIYVAGGPVLWKTKKQTFVALSTTEAEFANLTPAGQSLKWVAKILEECGAPQQTPNLLFTDSHNAFLTVMNPLNSARTRCIDIRYKWVIEQVKRGHLKLEHVNGTEMPADGLTKALGREKHARFLTMLGIAQKTMPWLEG